MEAIILAGGLGQRLKEVVPDLPKPMAPINGRPFLEFIVLQLRAFSIFNIIISIGYKGDVIKRYFGDGSKWCVNIKYSEETEPLGTGGAVKHAGDKIKGSDFIVINGDTYLELDFHSFINFHRDHKAVATIAIITVEDDARYGHVLINKESEIVKFDEKGRTGVGLINGGVYCLRQEVITLIPDGISSIEYNLFPKILGKGLYGFHTQGKFIDIGTPESFMLAQVMLKE